MPRRSNRPRRRREYVNFRNLGVVGATLTDTADGTASRLTNISTLVEQTRSNPDLELNRSLLARVRGHWIGQPDSVGQRAYLMGFLIAPSTLDAADVDPDTSEDTGFAWWFTKTWLMIGTTVTSDDATPEFRPIRGTYSSRGVRKMRNRSDALWLVERVQGDDLDLVAHSFDLTIALP